MIARIAVDLEKWRIAKMKMKLIIEEFVAGLCLVGVFIGLMFLAYGFGG